MEQRRYDVSRYNNVAHITHDNLTNFLNSSPTDGIHSFQMNGRQVDILIEAEGRRKDVALIFFPAAATKSVETYPYFNGRNTARKLNATLLAFSDPALGISLQVMAGWTVGDVSYPFHRDIPAIVEHVTGHARKVFAGISAGGFPALHFGSYFPDSLSFVVNPRTSIFNPPSHLFQVAEFLYPNLDGKEIAEIIPVELERAQNTVFYAQNHPDTRYVSSHMVPFMNKNIDTKQIYWRLGNWGAGHTRMPDSELIATVRALIDAPNWSTGALQAAGTPFADLAGLMAEYASLRLSEVSPLTP